MTKAGRGSSLLTSLASNWLGLAVGVLVSFFLSPFVVDKLGAAWYGVWAVTGAAAATGAASSACPNRYTRPSE